MYHSFAPGRVELLGNHTDYNQGVVLSTAIDLGTTVSGEKTGDGRVVLSSDGFPVVDRDLSLPLEPRREWADYALGVVRVFLDAGYPISGFRASFTSTLPVGAGLSSSAAMEVATAELLRVMFGIEMDPLSVAKLCRRAENEFVGVGCGLLDQVSSVFGRKQHVIYLDCRDETVERIPFPDDVELLIVNSAVAHALNGGEYNERREQCAEAARRMGVDWLREATFEMLAATDMPDVVRRRAAHIIGENERVGQAVEFLQAGNVEAVGELLSDSHRSSMENFENSTPELDILVKIALDQKGVLGSRLTGGGFGGATVTLVRSEAVDTVMDAIVAGYLERTGIHTTAFRCRSGDGAIPCA